MAEKQPLQSGIYTGKVMHQRLLPKQHGFSYRTFSCVLILMSCPAYSN
ncbi:DUF1365 family protein [Aliamphritea spongicola]